MANLNPRSRWALSIVAAASLAVGMLPCQDAKETKFRGRLPAHYGDIVSEAQRLQIYAVQEKYFKQIDELKDKLALLEAQRDREIENVLSPEQKTRLKKVVDAAAALRKKKAADQAADQAKPKMVGGGGIAGKK